jgi:hypothetical protein
MKLLTIPARPTALAEPTVLFRRRAWTAFEKSLDPLGSPRPLRAVFKT